MDEHPDARGARRTVRDLCGERTDQATLQRGTARRPLFWRDNAGHEVNVLYETKQGLQAVEIKSGSTFASDWPDAIHKWKKFAADEALPPVIVYGGEGDYERQACRVIGWRELQGLVL